MKHFESSASIKATAEQIWSILTDGAGYTEWDSGVISLEGTIAPGQKLKVRSSANPGRAFALTVTEFIENQSMTWSGGMPLGLFKGVRTYRLTPGTEGTTDFHMREDYSGPLTGMISKSIPDLQPSFDQFAAGLKAKAEES